MNRAKKEAEGVKFAPQKKSHFEPVKREEVANKERRNTIIQKHGKRSSRKREPRLRNGESATID